MKYLVHIKLIKIKIVIKLLHCIKIYQYLLENLVHIVENLVLNLLKTVF